MKTETKNKLNQLTRLTALIALYTIVGATGQAQADLKEVNGCAQSTTKINEIATTVDHDWADFEKFIEDETGLNIKGCMQNRFQDNGKIDCESSSGGTCSGANGWASYLSHTAHFCPTFVNRVRALTGDSNKKACYLALMTHEFGHTCWRGHGTVEDIDDAAFKYAKKTLPGVTIDLIDCGMD